MNPQEYYIKAENRSTLLLEYLHSCFDMLLVDFCTTLLVCVTAVMADRKNITIGGIVADEGILPFGLHRTGPAIEMGIERLRELVAEEADVTFVLNVTSEECVADRVGAIAAEMHYIHKVSAFIGPGKSPFTAQNIRLFLKPSDDN